MMTNANLTVVFGDNPPADGSAAYGNMSIDLDPLANADTNFSVGETAYLRILSQGFTQSETYEVLISGGVIERVMTGIPYPVEEDVTFAFSSDENLKYLPVGPVAIEWIGNVPSQSVATVTENDRSYIRTPQPIVAVARVSYETPGDRWALTFDQEGPVVVVAMREGKTASATVNFGLEPDETAGPFQWELVTVNYGDGEPEPNVSVSIDGLGDFETDENGRVFLGLVSAGDYGMVLTRDTPELIPSPDDSIQNDMFTIPASNPNQEDDTI